MICSISVNRNRTAPRILTLARAPDAASRSSIRTEHASKRAASGLVRSCKCAGVCGLSAVLFVSPLMAAWFGIGCLFLLPLASKWILGGHKRVVTRLEMTDEVILRPGGGIRRRQADRDFHEMPVVGAVPALRLIAPFPEVAFDRFGEAAGVAFADIKNPPASSVTDDVGARAVTEVAQPAEEFPGTVTNGTVV